MTQPQNIRKYLSKLNINFQSIEQLTYKDLIKEHSPFSIQQPTVKLLQFIYILNGSLTVSHLSHDYHLKAGDYFLIYLNDATTIDKMSADLEIYDVKISSVNLHELLNRQNEQIFSYFPSPDNQVKMFLELMAGENSVSNRVVQQILLEALFVKIIRDQDIEMIELPSHQSHHEVDCVKQYIHANYAKNITLDDLAELSGMNKYYLVHIFKRDTGKSPIDYLIHVRLEEAKSLLTNSTLPIAKIAELVGFSSQSYFSKMFKRETRINPSHFRKQNLVKVIAPPHPKTLPGETAVL